MVTRVAQGLRVLVAEDEPLAALVIEEVLAAEGHAVTLAEDGEVALTLAQRETFDVLVTDLAMPRMTGMELIRRLRQDCPDLPVVIMTGYLSPGDAAQLRDQARPPVALLHKPFQVDSLLTALARLQPQQQARAAC